MNYEERKASEASTSARLREVVELGVSQGLWAISEVRECETTGAWLWVDLKTPEGLAFSGRGGSWGREKAVTLNLASQHGAAGLRVAPSDVVRYGTEVPSASCTYTRSPESILKDWKRRMLENPDALKIARDVVEALKQREQGRESLLATVETLKGHGFSFGNVPVDACTETTGYGGAGLPYRVRVRKNGTCELEVTIQADKMGQLLELLKS